MALNARTFDQLFDFTRTGSRATRVNSVGEIETVAADEPRFDHDPVTGEAKGLLIEESRENLVTYSEDFAIKSPLANASVLFTPNHLLSPDGRARGTLAGDNADGASAQSYIEDSVTVSTSTAYTLSVFAKAVSAGAGIKLASISFTTPANGGAFFDLESGTVTLEETGHTASIEDYGNGWYRCSTTFTTDAADTSGNVRINITKNGATTYTRDGTSVALFGWTFEAGAFPTSYIDTSPTFTSRASTAGYFNSTGVYTLAAVDEARTSDHRYIGGEWVPTGLTLEEAATNIALYSDRVGLDGFSWSGFSEVVTPNAAIAPNGKAEATRFQDNGDGVNTTCYSGQSVTVSTSTQYCISVFAKADQSNWLAIAPQTFTTPANDQFAYYNLSTGELGTVLAGLDDAGIEDYGDGWYRCWLTFTSDGTDTTGSVRINLAESDGDLAFTHDGTRSVFLWGLQLEANGYPTSYYGTNPSFTSRASTATYYDASGVLQTAAVDEARDSAYMPVDGTFVDAGLVLEAASTNLLLQSEEFDNASWTKVASTVTANAIAAPDGATTADKIVEDSTASSVHGVQRTADIAPSTRFVLSVYAKAAERNWIRLGPSLEGGSLVSTYFDIQNGTVGTVGGVSATIEDVGGGWYRCIAVFDNDTGATPNTMRFSLSTGDGTVLYNGDGTSGLYIWGAQVEEGDYATSYIPTTTTSVTRSADVSSSSTATRSADVVSSSTQARGSEICEITGTNFSEWFNASEGTFFVEVTLGSKVVNAYALSASDDTNNERILSFYSNGSGNLASFVSDGNVNQANPGYGTAVANTNYKCAFAYKANDFAGCVDGGTVQTDTSGTIPTVTQLTIGAGYTGTFNPLCGHIKDIRFYPTRLSNAQLQSITS